jgi:hypothetical protein
LEAHLGLERLRHGERERQLPVLGNVQRGCLDAALRDDTRAGAADDFQPT